MTDYEKAIAVLQDYANATTDRMLEVRSEEFPDGDELCYLQGKLKGIQGSIQHVEFLMNYKKDGNA
jgi:hypothetical protein